ncbi:hypothetical protein B0H16DRAFT_1694156 [Mycena metata]|uniref:F-box domain-containing protein n=1 Tax=Mycena metata TaxID=1033252 RepID=A0AAD7IG04_9AGAR|nr:hypothetical protein B0H16DRAFT_1694156 [Mycena metata]
MPPTCERCGTALQVAPEPRPQQPEVASLNLNSPDLTSLLKNNEAPSDSQIPAILDIVSTGQGRLNALDTQIYALQATLTQLVRERRETAELVRRQRAIISAVRRVPPELLCDIFAWSVSGRSEGYRAQTRAPWHLGHICRSWRQIAVSYLFLWTNITIGDDTTRSGLEAQLVRSANAPLTIHWFGFEKGKNPGWLDLVLPHCDRWRSLYLDPHSPRVVNLWSWELHQLAALAILNVAVAPKLEELTYISMARQAIPQLLSFIRRSSCTLTKLVLVHCQISPEFIHLLQALPALTYLFVDCDRATPENAMTIRLGELPLCPNLTSLIYRYSGFFSSSLESFFAMVKSRSMRDSDRTSRLSYLRILDSSRKPQQNVIDHIATLSREGQDAAFLVGREAEQLIRRHKF